MEVGGRWSLEASKFISALARAKSREEPVHLRETAFSTWHRRWSRIISIVGQCILAASLLSLPEIRGAGANIPSVDVVLAEGRYEVELGDETILTERDNTISPEMATPCGRGGVVGRETSRTGGE